MEVFISVNSAIVSQNFFMSFVFIPAIAAYDTAPFALREEMFLEPWNLCLSISWETNPSNAFSIISLIEENLSKISSAIFYLRPWENTWHLVKR